MEVHADERGSDAGAVAERGGHGLLHDALGGGARLVVEADVEAGCDRDQQRREERGDEQAAALSRHGYCRELVLLLLLPFSDLDA